MYAIRSYYGFAGTRLNNPNNGQAESFRQRRKRYRRSGVAGDNNHLYPMPDQESGCLQGIAHNGLGAFRSVRDPGRIPQIDNIFLRKLADNLFENRQTANPRVKNTYGTFGQKDILSLQAANRLNKHDIVEKLPLKVKKNTLFPLLPSKKTVMVNNRIVSVFFIDPAPYEENGFMDFSSVAEFFQHFQTDRVIEFLNEMNVGQLIYNPIFLGTIV